MYMKALKTLSIIAVVEQIKRDILKFADFNNHVPLCFETIKFKINCLPPTIKENIANDLSQFMCHSIFKFRKFCYKNRHTEQFKELIEMLFPHHLKSIKVENLHPNNFASNYLLDYLSTFRYLRILEIREISIGCLRKHRNKIAKSLKMLTNLICFKMEFCNNKIIISLALNCPQIRILHILDHSKCTNDIIPFLKKFQHLEDLHIDKNVMSLATRIKLFLNISTLKGVKGNNDNELVMKMLENVDSEKALNLDILQCTEMDQDHLKLIAKTCPKLRSLILSHLKDIDHIDFSSLGNLKHLCSLEIAYEDLNNCEGYFDYHENGLGSLLEKVGEQLYYLKLGKQVLLDFDALADIGKKCPNLRTFKFCGRFISGSTSNYIQPMLFKGLETLHLGTNNAHPHIMLLLSNCTNLKDLGMVLTTRLKHQTLLAITERNPLKELTSIYVNQCDFPAEIVLERIESKNFKFIYIDSIVDNFSWTISSADHYDEISFTLDTLNKKYSSIMFYL